MTVQQEFVRKLRTELPKHGDEDRAAGQQRYLKTNEPMLGLRIPELRTLVRQQAREFNFTPEDLLDTARALWDEATHRDYRRAALILLLLPRHAKLVDSTAMELVEHCVRTGAWWDLVDEAVHLQRIITPTNTAVENKRMRDWSTDPDHWIRRYAILSQLQAKEDTDTELLTDVIVANLGDKEFFVAKAIGWALRDYARINPSWVRNFVDQHPTMQLLSRREALKHL